MKKVLSFTLALVMCLSVMAVPVFAAPGSDKAGAMELKAGQSDTFTMPKELEGNGWYKFNLSAASKVDITLSIENNEVNTFTRVVGVYHEIGNGNQMPAYVGVTGEPLGEREQERSTSVGIGYYNDAPSITGTYYLAAGWCYINVDWRNSNDEESTQPLVTIKIDSIEPISNTGGLTVASAKTVNPSNEVIKHVRFEHDDWEIGHYYYTFTLSEAAEVTIEKSVKLVPSKDERVMMRSSLWLIDTPDTIYPVNGKADGQDAERLEIWEKRDTPLTQTITYALQKGTYYVVLDNSWAFPGTEYTLSFSMSGSAPNLDSASDWAKEGLTTATGAGLVPGNLQSSYTQATTRAEFAALAVTLYEIFNGEITGRETFSDTDDVNVQKAAAIGVVNGVGNNNFDPNSGLTREQAATMLARLANAVDKPIPESAPTFSDNGSVSDWASAAVGQMQSTGIMGGVGNNLFDPAGAYTREQSIITILRLYDYLKSN
jgi:hypothetical protein